MRLLEKMGKKGYNWRSRTVPEVKIESTSTKSVVIDITHRNDTYDECNTLLLPSKKRRTIKHDVKSQKVKLLSKKHRKQLEKVLERKEKKKQRKVLLEELSKVQASPEELKQYISITTIQTKGLKRHREPETDNPRNRVFRCNDTEDESEKLINSIKGNRKRRLEILEAKAPLINSSDPNVVGYNVDSHGSSSEYESSSNDLEAETIVECSEVSSEDVETRSERCSKPSNTAPNLLTPSVSIVTSPPKPKKIESKPCSILSDRKPTMFVTLDRTSEIQQSRLKLPVLAEEQQIVEAINEHAVVIITGETGSGKTTQIPQFLYEAGYANSKMIGVTEPRRVAAISMSKRVAEEMNLSTDQVSYLIRFEGNTTPNTNIKFMTDGVLLKEVQSDFLLSKYSVIILDEAHERSIYTDILIGLLSRIVPMRAKRNDPLKLIIMSATLRVDDFLENRRLFRIKPPLITVESRQFPVTIHFNRRTSNDYVTDAIKKAVKIHTKLPEGGILIFLTGQHEVNSVVRKLRKTFPYRKIRGEKTKAKDNSKDTANDDYDVDEDDFNPKDVMKQLKNKLKAVSLPTISLDDYSSIPTDDTQGDLFSDGDDHLDEGEDDDFVLDFQDVSTSEPMWVLPLYSLLPAHKQAQVFQSVPEGCRLCVVATNVAETSLTIPHIKYVVDSGKCKTRMYDKVTGVSTFKVTWTSQAGANQRAGRAGRMGPGHCYRLYSSAVFNDQFEKFSMAEIQRKPVDDLLLQMKVMNIAKVVNFPFPSPPDSSQLMTAENRLKILGALEPALTSNFSSKVTPLGKSIAAFPVCPRFGKMLAISQQSNLLKYTICLVSALSVQELLIEGFSSENSQNKKKWLKCRRLWAGAGNNLLLGDPMVLLHAVSSAEYSDSQGKLTKFCEENGVRPKAISEVKKLRQQLTNEIILNIPHLQMKIEPHMAPPTDMEALLLRQIMLSGLADHIAKKISPEEIKEGEDKHKYKFAYKTLEMEDPVFMHSTCVLRSNQPEWVVYQEVYETNKMYMRGVTAIEPEWLPKLATSLCRIAEPLADPAPRWEAEEGKVMCHVRGSIGKAGWELPSMEIEFPEGDEGVRWFAKFFLEGIVCEKLKRFVEVLVGSPSSVNKAWGKMLPRVEGMVKGLMQRGVMTKRKLEEVWRDDRKFLLDAYLKWIPESAHTEVKTLWPPV